MKATTAHYSAHKDMHAEDTFTPVALKTFYQEREELGDVRFAIRTRIVEEHTAGTLFTPVALRVFMSDDQT